MLIQVACNQRKKKITRYKFSPDEDEELLHLVSIFGKNDWKTVSEELSKNCLRKDANGKNITRNARQCKERYLNYLSDDITKSQWTPEEDHLLELQTLIHLHKWKDIKPFFPGRTEISLRNRFNFIHRGHFKTIKPLIYDQIKKNSICHQNTPNEIVQQAIDIRNKAMNSINTKNLEGNSFNLINKYVNLSSFQKLYEKYNNDSIVYKNNDTANLLLTAVKDENFKNKVEYIKEELSSLSTFVENRALFEMVTRSQPIISEVTSDYESFIMNS